MGSKRRKDRRIYKIEISRGGLVVIGLATFGVLLWMFIFGIWVGRGLYTGTVKKLESTALPPSAQAGEETKKCEKPVPAPIDRNGIFLHEKMSQDGQPVQDEVPPKLPSGDETVDIEKASPGSKVFFTLQVASLRDANKAEELKKVWEKKGYEVFVTRNEAPTGAWYRVQIGRFSAVGEANTLANRIAEKEKTKMYITTVTVPAFPDAITKD